jgi:hypothetical protein
MKNIFLGFIATLISVSLIAQGNSGNADKGKQKDKGKPEKVDEKVKVKGQSDKDQDHNNKVWEGVSGSEGCGIPSKNQPAKVRSSFQRDYPNTTSVTWTKCRGDWTATFNNGLWRSTAVYHANGQRKDTRTPVTKDQVPRPILDDIFKKRPAINLGNIIKIELPGTTSDIFRIRLGTDLKPGFTYYNSAGAVVTYNY